MKIAGRMIGANQPVFLIAEMSANHVGDFDIAMKTVEAAKNAGADAIKLQTYTPDTITLNCDNDYFKIKQGSIWDGQTFYQLYESACTPWDWQPKIKEYAESLGLVCFSSPFDKTAVDFLEKIDVPAYKVSSFEITDIPLIEYIAKKQKPILISTGIAGLCDIEEAITTCRKVGNDQIALLKCTSAYPAPYDEMNLKTIPNLANAFSVPVGLSDHTIDIIAPVAAVSLGACIVEKHFTLDRDLGGPDASFSLNPKEFASMVDAVRITEKVLGRVAYSHSSEVSKLRDFSRSLFASADINEGEILTDENVRSVRPGYGLPPKYLPRIIGKKATRNISFGEPLRFSDVDGIVD
jgi:pseudaminic acid synthase